MHVAAHFHDEADELQLVEPQHHDIVTTGHLALGQLRIADEDDGVGGEIAGHVQGQLVAATIEDTVADQNVAAYDGAIAEIGVEGDGVGTAIDGAGMVARVACDCVGETPGVAEGDLVIAAGQRSAGGDTEAVAKYFGRLLECQIENIGGAQHCLPRRNRRVGIDQTGERHRQIGHHIGNRVEFVQRHEAGDGAGERQTSAIDGNVVAAAQCRDGEGCAVAGPPLIEIRRAADVEAEARVVDAGHVGCTAENDRCHADAPFRV